MTNKTIKPILVRRALISVSDKTGILELAHALHAINVEIISTGGTATLLKENNIPVVDISDFTGFPEMMAGRVKTLHPKVHGAILGRRGIDDSVMSKYDIPPIDLVVVNLYPFQQTITKPNVAFEDAIENIDIGGPTLIRAAAKNHESVCVVVEPADYHNLIAELQQHANQISYATRFECAKKAFAHTAQYDAAIANYLGVKNTSGENSKFPDRFSVQFIKKQDLRYGENPHQKAAFYSDLNPEAGSIATATQIQGKELSYNNIADADAALECVKSFDQEHHACVIVKHANPCGIAVAASQTECYQRAYQTDPTSSFGGIIAFNQKLTAATLKAILSNQFVEVIIAPAIDDDATQIASDKPNVRILVTGPWSRSETTRLDFKRVNSGLLIQDQDIKTADFSNLKVVTKKQPTDAMMKDLWFAWHAVKFVKSNAIVFVKDRATIGIGAGQMSRIDSVKIAASKAEEAHLQIQGAVMASDAFFPFRDTVDAAAKYGIAAIIQPGGSMRDQEVIAAADEAGICMIFTGFRHFRH